MFDYDNFLVNIQKKAENYDYYQNIDMMIVLCLRDIRNYKYYIKENGLEAGKFSVCYETFAHILMNRAALADIEAKNYSDICEDFLDSLEEEEEEYFDVCVNITCELIHLLMYISTKDIRNVIAAMKLSFESAEAHFQECDLDEEEYDLKISKFAELIENFDVKGLTEFLNYD